MGLVGAMLLPTIATACGQILFKRERNNFKRTMMGGLSFPFAKGLLKLYYKQQQYERQVHRQILDYDVAVLRQTAAAAAAAATQAAGDQAVDYIVFTVSNLSLGSNLHVLGMGHRDF